eukprot:gene1258-4467_t
MPSTQLVQLCRKQAEPRNWQFSAVHRAARSRIPGACYTCHTAAVHACTPPPHSAAHHNVGNKGRFDVPIFAYVIHDHSARALERNNPAQNNDSSLLRHTLTHIFVFDVFSIASISLSLIAQVIKSQSPSVAEACSHDSAGTNDTQHNLQSKNCHETDDWDGNEDASDQDGDDYLTDLFEAELTPRKKLSKRARSLFVIEMPGTINCPRNAVDALGGTETLAQVGKEMKDLIKLQLRPGDPFAHPITGRRCDSKAIVLKIKRRVGSTNPDDFHVDCIGRINHLYKFSEPADFQFVPGIPPPNVQINFRSTPRVEDDILHPDYFSVDVPALITPPAFCTSQPKTAFKYLNNLHHSHKCAVKIVSHSHYFSFSENPLQDRIKQQAESKNAARQKDRANEAYTSIDFDSPNVPTTPPTEAAEKLLHRHTINIKNKLTKLFDSRPIWSTNALYQRLGADCGSALKNPLRLVSYRMITGPWRNLNIRYGYDPRKHREAHRYQLVDWNCGAKDERLHLRRSMQSRIFEYLDGRRTATISTNYTPYIFQRGIAPQQRQASWQLCDIHDEEIQAVLCNSTILESCDRETGWLEEKTLTKIRVIIKEAIEYALGQASNNSKPVSPPSIAQDSAHTPKTVSQSSSQLGNFQLLEDDDDDDDDDGDVEHIRGNDRPGAGCD